MEDRELIDRCIRGETRAWQTLVDRHGQAVADAARYTLRRVLGSARDEDIENIVQGVFLGLCDRNSHRLRLFQGRAAFRTWITSVTCRFGLNYIRTEKRKGSLKYCALEDSAGEMIEGGSDPLPETEDRERLHAALEKIPSRERLVLKLVYFDGLSYKTTAEILKIPVNSVSPLVLRAKDSLRRHLVAP